MTPFVAGDQNSERSFHSARILLPLAGIVWVSCSEPSAPPEETPPSVVSEVDPPAENEPTPGAVADVPAPRATAEPAPRADNPLDLFADKAAAYVSSQQAEDGSWPYFQSRTADFAEPQSSADVLGTMTILMNLKHTDLEASPMFERGVAYVASRMDESGTWALDGGRAFSGDSRSEPDADRTSLALTLLAERFPIEPGRLEELRSLFGRHRTPEGLYRTYFEGFYPEKGFVPDRNDPSIGVNLNVLGFFGRYGLDRASLVEALGSAIRRERYWEESPFYLSLPLLAYLASNAVEHGAPEAEELLRRFLADVAATSAEDKAFAEKLGTVELAAYVKARSRLCLLERSPCRDLDMVVFELSKRRKQDGSWPVAPFYEHDANPEALRAFVERRDYTLVRDRGGVGYDVGRALASPEAARFYGGSSAETTTFALKAVVLYRELLVERPAFGVP